MTPEAVYRLARDHGLNHEQAITATAIAWAESGLREDAVGDEALQDDKWGVSKGLYQVRSLLADTGTGRERDIERLGDPSFNTRSMVAISAGGTNWTPWSVFKNRRYLNHLEAVREAVSTGEPMTPVQIIEAAMAELEEQGYKVTFVDGWEDRTVGGSFNPQGLLWHHTATNRRAQGDYPSLGIVRDGVDQGGGYFLRGPLSQFGLGRSGRVYVIAAGKAHHAGGGGWNDLSGNGSVWGIEAENDGIGEPWPSEQIDAYIALSAALARHTGFGAEMVCRHAEWSDGGKIDTAGDLSDGDWIRARVAERLAGAVPEPVPEPEPEPEEEMRSSITLFNWGGAVWAWPGGDPLPLFTQEQVVAYLEQGAIAIGDITDVQFEAIAPTWGGDHKGFAVNDAGAELVRAAVPPAPASLACADQ